MFPRRTWRVLFPLAAAAILAGAATAAPATGLPAPTAADTVRTNLWLTEALMAEIVTAVAQTLPAAPAALRLEGNPKEPADQLFGAVATRVLGARGYDLYAAETDSSRQAAVDAVIGYKVLGVDLAYPEVGRTLGLWRRWVERDLAVSALVTVTEADSGRLLLNERLVRRFSDRVPGGDFDDVQSPLYDFTAAETGESGWQRRIEEIAVLGALAGLVAIYFANTQD